MPSPSCRAIEKPDPSPGVGGPLGNAGTTGVGAALTIEATAGVVVSTSAAAGAGGGVSTLGRVGGSMLGIAFGTTLGTLASREAASARLVRAGTVRACSKKTVLAPGFAFGSLWPHMFVIV